MRFSAALLVFAALAAAAAAFLPHGSMKHDPAAVRKFVEDTVRLSRAAPPASDPLALTVDSLPTTSRHAGAHDSTHVGMPQVPTVEMTTPTPEAEGGEVEDAAGGMMGHSHEDDEDADHHDDDDDEAKKQCKTNTRFDRVITLAASFNKSEGEYEFLDNESVFLKAGLGLSAAEIAEQKDEALQFFERQFGVPRSKFDMPTTFTSAADIPSGRMAFFSVVMSQRNNIIADSSAKVPCADTYALWGGFSAVGRNITLNGEFSGRVPVYYPGIVTFFNYVMIFAPGTSEARGMLFRGIRPLACDFTGCTISAITTTLKEGFVGDADGTVQSEPPMVHTRVVLTWPSRFV